MAKRVRKPKKVAPSDPIPIPEYDTKYMGVYEHIADVDPTTEWEEIRAWLNEQPKTLVELKELIRKSADMAARAKDLYLVSKAEKAEFDLRYKERVQIWRVAAMQFWEGEKQRGMRKQITNDMLTDWMIEEHSDLYIELEKRKTEMATVVDSMKSLSESVVNRGRDLRQLLDSETRRPTSPSWMDGDKEGGK